MATCKVDSYLEEHPVLVGEPFWHQASGKLMSSMHSWMIMAIKQASTPRAG